MNLSVTTVKLARDVTKIMNGGTSSNETRLGYCLGMHFPKWLKGHARLRQTLRKIQAWKCVSEQKHDLR